MAHFSKYRPATTRSRFMLELASELVGVSDFDSRQAQVQLRVQGATSWDLTLLASDGPDTIQKVVDGEVTLGIVNPAVLVTLASSGIAPFRGALPVAAIAVIPSYDQLAVAVRAEVGVDSLEEIHDRRCPLRISVRGQRNHGVHWVIDHVLQAHGWTVGDLISWGGQVSYDEGLPARGARLQMLADGTVDAIIDEGVGTWLDDAVAAGARAIGLSDAALDRLEAWGYRRAALSRDRFPALSGDVPTIDFSGFAVYLRNDAPDHLVETICAAIVSRADRMILQDGSQLPLGEIFSDAPAAPLPVPVHPAAARFWAAGGHTTSRPGS